MGYPQAKQPAPNFNPYFIHLAYKNKIHHRPKCKTLKPWNFQTKTVENLCNFLYISINIPNIKAMTMSITPRSFFGSGQDFSEQ